MPSKLRTPPINLPFLEHGNLHKEWNYWFQQITKAVDSIKQPPFKVFRDQGATLDTSYLGAIIHFENGTKDVVCRLPRVEVSDIYSWITIYRMGSGKLSIRAADQDRIEVSSKGGVIYCDEAGRRAANITLTLIKESLWAITSGTGIWKPV